jgi:hypothetical protein
MSAKKTLGHSGRICLKKHVHLRNNRCASLEFRENILATSIPSAQLVPDISLYYLKGDWMAAVCSAEFQVSTLPSDNRNPSSQCGRDTTVVVVANDGDDDDDDLRHFEML